MGKIKPSDPPDTGGLVPTKHTLTLTFAGDDLSVYEKLKADAKADRRDLNDFVLLQILKANA